MAVQPGERCSGPGNGVSAKEAELIIGGAVTMALVIISMSFSTAADTENIPGPMLPFDEIRSVL